MNQILALILANDLRDLSGSSVHGSIPIKEEFINDLINLLLQESRDHGDHIEIASPKKSGPGLDPQNALALLKRLSIRATEGTVQIDFEVRV